MIPCPKCGSSTNVTVPEVYSLRYYCQRCSILFNYFVDRYEYVALSNMTLLRNENLTSNYKDMKSYFTGMKDAIRKYFINGMSKEAALEEIEKEEKKFV